MKPMTKTTLQALRRIYESPAQSEFVTLSVANALQRRRLAIPAEFHRPRFSGRALRLTKVGTTICAALFGPLKFPMNEGLMERLPEHYVVIWDFESEESGEVMKDGLVFRHYSQAQNEALEKVIANVDAEFGGTVRPLRSQRLQHTGYVASAPQVRRVFAQTTPQALAIALDGGGEEIDWSK